MAHPGHRAELPRPGGGVSYGYQGPGDTFQLTPNVLGTGQRTRGLKSQTSQAGIGGTGGRTRRRQAPVPAQVSSVTRGPGPAPDLSRNIQAEWDAGYAASDSGRQPSSPVTATPATTSPVIPIGGGVPSLGDGVPMVPSLTGLSTAASNVSGGSGAFAPGEGGESFGSGVALSGPGALRQGIGNRILPRDSMSLAALRRIY